MVTKSLPNQKHANLVRHQFWNSRKCGITSSILLLSGSNWLEVVYQNERGISYLCNCYYSQIKNVIKEWEQRNVRQTLTNKWNFGIRQFMRSWIAVKWTNPNIVIWCNGKNYQSSWNQKIVQIIITKNCNLKLQIIIKKRSHPT